MAPFKRLRKGATTKAVEEAQTQTSSRRGTKRPAPAVEAPSPAVEAPATVEPPANDPPAVHQASTAIAKVCINI